MICKTNVSANLFPFEEGGPALKPLDHGLTCFHAWFPLTLSLLVVVVVVVVLSCHLRQLLDLLLPSCSSHPPFYLVEGKVSVSSFSLILLLPLSHKILLFPFFSGSRGAGQQSSYRLNHPEKVTCFLFTNEPHSLMAQHWFPLHLCG